MQFRMSPSKAAGGGGCHRSHLVNNTLPLQELFNNRVFRVPDYQRGYAWEQQQVGEFLDDLELLSSARHHYTGTIVLYQPSNATKKTDDEGTSYVETDVVDGQQRLTTIVLLLNEISRALSAYEGSSSLAQGIRKNYVKRTSLYGLPLYKLSLNKDTDGFFKSGVLPETLDVAGPPITSAQRLLNAKEEIANYLRKAGGDTASQEQWLRDLQRKVTTRLHFNLYEVEDAAEVGVIFEVMNDRGKPLTNLEKVKNYLLYAASTLDVTTVTKNDLTKSVNDAWADMLKQLMAAGLSLPSEEDQLLRAHWIMQYDPKARNWDGSKSIKSSFDLRRYPGQPGRIVRELDQYIKGLWRACTCYCDARRPDRDGAFASFSSEPGVRNDVKLWNSKFVRIGATATFLPLLMAVRTRWPSEPKNYLEIVKLCEVFAFRIYRVAQLRSDFRQPHMFRLAYDVADDRVKFDDAVREIKRCYRSWNARRRFDVYTDAGTPRDWYNEERGFRYLLFEYEERLSSAKGASPKVSWMEIRSAGLKDTVEHVLPQSIKDRPYWQERFDKDAHKKYVHDIGNLTLTKHNSSYSNKPFPEKKGAIDANGRCYAGSPFFQEQELAQYDEWTREAINERRTKLLEWAKERWRVDFSGIDAVEPENDDDEEGDDAGAE